MKLKSVVSTAILAGLVALASPAAAVPFDVNLIANAGAETGDLGGWSTTGALEVVMYGAPGDFPTLADPGPVDRGLWFFSGGDGEAVSTGSQAFDVTAEAALIDAGLVGFDLSGYLGGYRAQDDNAVLGITFLDALDVVLGGASIGPVLALERDETSGMLLRMISGLLPAGTREIALTLTMTRTFGSYNDGYADNLSLVLSDVAEVPEPGTLLLLGAGMAFAARAIRSRR